MMRLIADNLSLSILEGVYDEVELLDATGTRVIGHFIPVDLERKKQVYAEAIARTNREELARVAASPGPRRPVREVIQELKARYPIDAPAELPPGQPSVLPGSEECASP